MIYFLLQTDVNMEFTEQDDRVHHADGQIDSYFDLSTSAPLTPFNSIVQSLPSDALGTSESMSELPMSSLSPPTSLARAISTSPRLFHTTKDSCSTGDVHQQAYEDLGESGSDRKSVV